MKITILLIPSLVLMLLITGCGGEDEVEGDHYYSLDEGNAVKVVCDGLNDVPIYLDLVNDSTLGMIGMSIYRRKDSAYMERIHWVPWYPEGGPGEPGSSTETAIDPRIGTIRSFCMKSDSEVFVFAQSYRSPTMLLVSDLEGEIQDSIDFDNYLPPKNRHNHNEEEYFESLFVGPENPIHVHGDVIEVMALPYEPQIKEGAKLFLYHVREKKVSESDADIQGTKSRFGRHPLDLPKEYSEYPVSYGYVPPFTSLLGDQKMMIAYQGSPNVDFYNFEDSSSTQVEFEFEELAKLNFPREEDIPLPLLKSENGSYGPVYQIDSNLFVRQMFLSFEIPEEPSSNSLYYPHNRPCELVIYKVDGEKAEVVSQESHRYKGLGQLGFVGPDGRLYIIRSHESRKNFDSGNREIVFAAFDIVKKKAKKTD